MESFRDFGLYNKYITRDYFVNHGKTDYFTFASNQIAGYRTSQEDRIRCILKFHEDFSFFGVYDGHGGELVVEYVNKFLHHHILDFLKEEEDVEMALYQGFLSCDLNLKLITEDELAPVKDSIVKEYSLPQAISAGNADSSEAGPSKNEGQKKGGLYSAIASEVRNQVINDPSLLMKLIFNTPSLSDSDDDYKDNDDDDDDDEEEEEEEVVVEEEETEENMEEVSTENFPNADIVKEKKDEILKDDDAVKKKSQDEPPTEKFPDVDIVKEKKHEILKDDLTTQKESQNELPTETFSSVDIVKDKKDEILKDDETIEKESQDEPPTEKFSGVDLVKDKKDEVPMDDESIEKESQDEPPTEKFSNVDIVKDKKDEVLKDDLFMEREFQGEPLVGLNCGSTATVVLVNKKKIYVANIGDSRCVASINGKAVDLSVDHKPKSKQESERLSNAGCKVIGGRIDGVLDMSRSFGDFGFKMKNIEDPFQPVVPIPYIHVIDVSDDLDFLIIASDGIWNYMSSQQVVDYVCSNRDTELWDICTEVFELILKEENLSDNMSMCIIDLKKGSYDTKTKHYKQYITYAAFPDEDYNDIENDNSGNNIKFDDFKADITSNLTHDPQEEIIKEQPDDETSNVLPPVLKKQKSEDEDCQISGVFIPALKKKKTANEDCDYNSSINRSTNRIIDSKTSDIPAFTYPQHEIKEVKSQHFQQDSSSEEEISTIFEDEDDCQFSGMFIPASKEKKNTRTKEDCNVDPGNNTAINDSKTGNISTLTHDTQEEIKENSPYSQEDSSDGSVYESFTSICDLRLKNQKYKDKSEYNSGIFPNYNQEKKIILVDLTDESEAIYTPALTQSNVNIPNYAQAHSSKDVSYSGGSGSMKRSASDENCHRKSIKQIKSYPSDEEKNDDSDKSEKELNEGE